MECAVHVSNLGLIRIRLALRGGVTHLHSAPGFSGGPRYSSVSSPQTLGVSPKKAILSLSDSDLCLCMSLSMSSVSGVFGGVLRCPAVSVSSPCTWPLSPHFGHRLFGLHR